MKLNQIINLHKGLTAFVVIGLMIFFDNFTIAPYVYLALHGTYGLLWLLKEKIFPDPYFKEKINFFRILGLFICIAGVFTIISKGNLDFLINLNFTTGDLWVLGAALGWALYSIYLLNWKSKFSLMARFTLIAMFGFISLFPFFVLENIYFAKTNYNQTFLFWIIFAAISPSIIAFSLYTRLQKYVGASFAGFTLYLFAVYGSIFGIIIFEEPLLSFHYLGGLLVFTGVYFARKKA